MEKYRSAGSISPFGQRFSSKLVIEMKCPSPQSQPQILSELYSILTLPLLSFAFRSMPLRSIPVHFEPPVRIELTTTNLPCWNSSTELRGHILSIPFRPTPYHSMPNRSNPYRSTPFRADDRS